MSTKAIFATLCALGFACQPSTAGAQVVATVEQAKPRDPSTVALLVTYANKGSEPVALRLIDVPRTGKDEKLRSNALNVVGIDGSLPRYLGYHMGMTREALSRTQTLAPGEFMTRTINLNANYELKAGMSYDVSPTEYRQSPVQHSEECAASRDRQHCNRGIFTTPPTIRITVPDSTTPHVPPKGAAGANTEKACTPDQLNAITAAMGPSSDLARDAKSYLASLYKTEVIDGNVVTRFNQTPRYSSWFGSHGDPDAPNPVNKRIRDVVNAAADRYGMLSPATCNCSDEDEMDGTTAWVDPNSAHVINYCPAFFKLPVGPNIQTGSRAVTIYHEVTHFDDFLSKGVSDLEGKFGSPDDARWVARNERDLAADNAYNFEYFADNYSSEE